MTTDVINNEKNIFYCPIDKKMISLNLIGVLENVLGFAQFSSTQVHKYGYALWRCLFSCWGNSVSLHFHASKLRILSKAPVTPNGDATAFVQRSKTMSARCGIAAKYA